MAGTDATVASEDRERDAEHYSRVMERLIRPPAVAVVVTVIVTVPLRVFTKQSTC